MGAPPASSNILRVLRWFSMRDTPPALAAAQFVEIKRQVPLVYALLIVNIVAVAFTHYRSTPPILTFGMGSGLVTLAAVRLATWLYKRKSARPANALWMLQRTTILGGLLAVVCTVWALNIAEYGDAFEQGHIAVFIGLTIIGCTFCLMHVPQAALLIGMIITGPYLIHYIIEGNPILLTIAVNIALINGVVIKVTFNSFLGFTALLRSQAELAARQGEAEALSRENASLAHTDSLTGLPNRRAFFGALADAIEHGKRSGERFAVGVLDLDRFKPINDTYGHAFGDRLLAQVGVRLQSAARDDIVVARLGGDEFGLLMTRVAADPADVGQRFCDLLSAPFRFDDTQVSLGCSCGLAVFPDAGSSVHELFDRSDYALYHVKTKQRGGSAVYSLEHETRIRSERAVEAALQAADFLSEIDVHFQPIVDATTIEVVAVEALARWNSPTLGIVPPDQFIPIAERAGLIHGLTLMLLTRTLDHVQRLPTGIGVSFNLSANDITSPETIEAVIERILASGIAPARITMELTETAMMRNFNGAAAAIRRLRSLGMQVALDDFGTGFSSLSYLHQLPLDRIKVDRSFVTDLDTPSGRKIITAIHGLCRDLAMECVIEGVENGAQLKVLRDIGYRFAQGYLFARPMRIDDLVAWLPTTAAEAWPTALLRGPRQPRRAA